jgi:hypothetical protein
MQMELSILVKRSTMEGNTQANASGDTNQTAVVASWLLTITIPRGDCGDIRLTRGTAAAAEGLMALNNTGRASPAPVSAEDGAGAPVESSPVPVSSEDGAGAPVESTPVPASAGDGAGAPVESTAASAPVSAEGGAGAPVDFIDLRDEPEVDRPSQGVIDLTDEPPRPKRRRTVVDEPSKDQD